MTCRFIQNSILALVMMMSSWAFATALPSGSEAINRIVAIVNDEPIMQSQVASL